MAENNPLSPEQQNEIILKALGICDFSKYTTRSERETAVVEAVLFVTRMLGEHSTPSRVLNATRITGVVKQVELEQNSQRFKITFLADRNGDGKDEIIRTDRIDSSNGPLVRRMIDQELVGHRCLIFKEVETSHADQTKKVRICPYVKRLD